jgi:hypothetical protein
MLDYAFVLDRGCDIKQRAADFGVAKTSIGSCSPQPPGIGERSQAGAEIVGVASQTPNRF